jgi:hypothetical protein
MHEETGQSAIHIQGAYPFTFVWQSLRYSIVPRYKSESRKPDGEVFADLIPHGRVVGMSETDFRGLVPICLRATIPARLIGPQRICCFEVVNQEPRPLGVSSPNLRSRIEQIASGRHLDSIPFCHDEGIKANSPQAGQFLRRRSLSNGENLVDVRLRPFAV